MRDDFLCPEDVDRKLNWPSGTTSRQCRRGRLPHYVMPDNSIRLCWIEIESLIIRVEPELNTGGVLCKMTPSRSTDSHV